MPHLDETITLDLRNFECPSATKRAFSRSFAAAIDLGSGSSDEMMGGLSYAGQGELGTAARRSAAEKQLRERRDADHDLGALLTRAALVVELAAAINRYTSDEAAVDRLVDSYKNPAVIVLAADAAMRALTAVQRLHTTLGDVSATTRADVHAFDAVALALDDLFAAAYVGLGFGPNEGGSEQRQRVLKNAVARSRGAASDARALIAEKPTSTGRAFFVSALALLKSLVSTLALQRFVPLATRVVAAVFFIEALLFAHSLMYSEPVTAFTLGAKDGLTGGVRRLIGMATDSVTALVPAPTPSVENQIAGIISSALAYTTSGAVDVVKGAYGVVRAPIMGAAFYSAGVASSVASTTAYALMPTRADQALFYLAGAAFYRFVAMPRAEAARERARVQQAAERELERQRRNAELFGEAVGRATERALERVAGRLGR